MVGSCKIGQEPSTFVKEWGYFFDCLRNCHLIENDFAACSEYLSEKWPSLDCELTFCCMRDVQSHTKPVPTGVKIYLSCFRKVRYFAASLRRCIISRFSLCTAQNNIWRQSYIPLLEELLPDTTARLGGGGHTKTCGQRTDAFKAHIKKTEFNVNNIQSFSPYGAVNELPFGYKNQSVMLFREIIAV